MAKYLHYCEEIEHSTPISYLSSGHPQNAYIDLSGIEQIKIISRSAKHFHIFLLEYRMLKALKNIILCDMLPIDANYGITFFEKTE